MEEIMNYENIRAFFVLLYEMYIAFFPEVFYIESDLMPYSESFILWNICSGYTGRIVMN